MAKKKKIEFLMNTDWMFEKPIDREHKEYKLLSYFQKMGEKLDKFNWEWFGEAKTVTVSKEKTTIIDGQGTAEAISERVESLTAQLEKAATPFEMEKLQERLSKFVGGVALVHVGGSTETEMKEKKDRVDDALHATQCVLEDGIVPGGGALKWVSNYPVNQGDIITLRAGVSQNTSYTKGVNRYLEPGNMVVSVYIKHLEEMNIDIRYGDFIGYPETEERIRYYTVVNDGKVTSDNKHNMFGFRPHYRTITCAIAQESEFRGI